MKRLSWLSLIAVCCISAWCSHANASGERRCDSRELSPSDTKRLIDAAKKKMPPDAAIDIPSFDICRNRGFARVGVQSIHTASAEGTEDWWALGCSRKWRDWSCDNPARWRTLRMDVLIQGTQRPLNVYFNETTPVATVKDLAARAFRVFDDASSQLARCAVTGFVLDPDSTWNEVRTTYKDRLDSDTDLGSIVLTEKGESRVELFGDARLAIHFPVGAEGAASPVPECWSQEWFL